ncbi:MAG: hypothetical protein FWE32_09205 [Oscillospiraceae bacterium]|nr:hypothetical protein [Oscillospiraceae bacterium]
MVRMYSVGKDHCLRCSGKMICRGAEQIQLGKTGFFFGSLGNLMSGALEVKVYTCQNCGKIEFYCNEPSDGS